MLVKSMDGPQIAAYIGQLHFVTLTCGGLRGFRRDKHIAILFHIVQHIQRRFENGSARRRLCVSVGR